MEDKFNDMLALEFSNPAYFKVHHISVPTFMLQTGRYTDAYREKAIALLKTFLKHPYNMPGAALVKEINVEFSSVKRNDNIFTKEAGTILESAFTVFDVRVDTPGHCCEDVIAWAKAVIGACDKLSGNGLAKR